MPDAYTLPAPVADAIAAAADAWFQEQFHGLGLVLDVALYNHLAAAQPALVGAVEAAVTRALDPNPPAAPAPTPPAPSATEDLGASYTP